MAVPRECEYRGVSGEKTCFLLQTEAERIMGGGGEPGFSCECILGETPDSFCARMNPEELSGAVASRRAASIRVTPFTSKYF